MAIIRLGPIVSAISGTVGTVVFVTGGRSTVARRQPIRVHKSSPYLEGAQSRMQGLRRRWRSMSSNQKLAWKTWATLENSTNVLGQTSPTSAYQLFMRVNLELRNSWSNAVVSPVALNTSDIPLNVATAFSASGTFTINADPPLGAPAASFFMYGWPFWTNQNPGSIPRLVFLQSAPGSPLSFDVRSYWQSHWGSMVEGQRFQIGVAALYLAIRRSKIITIAGTVAA